MANLKEPGTWLTGIYTELTQMLEVLFEIARILGVKPTDLIKDRE